MGIDDKRLLAFVRESNAIEGITRRPTMEELAIHRAFLQNEAPDVSALEAFVAIVAPGAALREREGMNVEVGAHRPPPGGPDIRTELAALLFRILGVVDPYQTHVEYETLHPFMDGNGRSGRVLWLWQMVRHGYEGQYGFLRAWYYESLQRSRKAET
jgi:hypothetical protein